MNSLLNVIYCANIDVKKVRYKNDFYIFHSFISDHITNELKKVAI